MDGEINFFYLLIFLLKWIKSEWLQEIELSWGFLRFLCRIRFVNVVLVDVEFFMSSSFMRVSRGLLLVLKRRVDMVVLIFLFVFFMIILFLLVVLLRFFVSNNGVLLLRIECLLYLQKKLIVGYNKIRLKKSNLYDKNRQGFIVYKRFLKLLFIWGFDILDFDQVEVVLDVFVFV